MAKNTLTLALEGDVSLAKFARAMQDFNGLVGELSREVASAATIEWAIQELYGGSAVATILGTYTDPVEVEKVVDAYEIVGNSLAAGEEIPYSPKVRKKANSLTGLIAGGITAIRFETAEKDAFISGKAVGETTARAIKYSRGTVKGIVQTLSMRKTLSFTLWDALFDKSVNCYLQAGQEEIMRNVWGKKAVVSGRVGRQPETGRPVVVREVKNIIVVEEAAPGSYRRAKGAIPWEKEEETPEEIIRRLRDA